jgi:hypothetical protein
MTHKWPTSILKDSQNHQSEKLKTTVRCKLIPVRMANIKKRKDNKCW